MRRETRLSAPDAADSTPAAAAVPAAELTPQVRAALAELAGEAERLRRQLADARARIAQLERLADEDALMPIANRRGFMRELARTMALARRHGTPSSVLYFDLDGLKAINDRWGHAAGDAALQHVARVLVENVRDSDVVARLGGDEFAVLLVRADAAAAGQKAASLAAAIAARPLPWQGGEIPLAAAYGVRAFAGGDETAGELLEAADRAMYEMKRRRRGG